MCLSVKQISMNSFKIFTYFQFPLAIWHVTLYDKSNEKMYWDDFEKENLYSNDDSYDEFRITISNVDTYGKNINDLKKIRLRILNFLTIDDD